MGRSERSEQASLPLSTPDVSRRPVTMGAPCPRNRGGRLCPRWPTCPAASWHSLAALGGAPLPQLVRVAGVPGGTLVILPVIRAH